MAGTVLDHPTWQQIEPHLWLFQGAGPMHINSLVLEDLERLILIDTQLEDENNLALIECMRAAFGDKPLRHVYISHYHLDHYIGLRWLRDAFGMFEILGPTGAREQIDRSTEAIWETYEEVAQQHTLTRDDIVYPTREIDGGFQIRFSDRVMHCSIAGPNEAWATITGLLSDTRTLYVSDVLLRGVYVDPAIGGTLRGWVREAAALAQLPARTVISGHVTSPVPHTELARFADGLQRLLDSSQALIDGGATLDVFLAHAFPDDIVIFAPEFTLTNIYNELRGSAPA